MEGGIFCLNIRLNQILPINENDAEVLSKMTRKELKEKLPDDWDYQEHNGRVHIKDGNKNVC